MSEDIEVVVFTPQDYKHYGERIDPDRQAAGYEPLSMVRLGTTAFVFTTTKHTPEKAAHCTVTWFKSVGYWVEGVNSREQHWPTNHPDDVARLVSCIMATTLSGGRYAP